MRLIKTLVLIGALVLTACDEAKINDTPILCAEGALLSDNYADLMKRTLVLDSIKGGLLYIEIQNAKTKLDILLKDACGYEIPNDGIMI